MNDRARKHVQAVKGGQLSRREFMAAMAAAGISSASASALARARGERGDGA